MKEIDWREPGDRGEGLSVCPERCGNKAEGVGGK